MPWQATAAASWAFCNIFHASMKLTLALTVDKAEAHRLGLQQTDLAAAVHQPDSCYEHNLQRESRRRERGKAWCYSG